MVDFTNVNALVQAMYGLPVSIRKALGNTPHEGRLWQPTPHEWSVHMVVAHLANCEPLFRERLQCIAHADNPIVLGFGPAEAPPHSTLGMDALLDELHAQRQHTLQQIYVYTPTDWVRPAVHSVNGPTTLQGQIQTIVNHDLVHLGQIHDVCALWMRRQMQRN